MTDYAIMHQEKPVPGDAVVLDTVLDRLGGSRSTSLRRALIIRAEMGKERYGRYLETHNGRSAKVDLYQELLDAMMYLTQHQMETANRWTVAQVLMSALFVLLRYSAVWVRSLLDGEEETI